MAISQSDSVELMLDSGAFSAWTRGQTLDLNKYIKYAKDRMHLVHTIVNLDTIPGVAGKKREDYQLEEAAKKSYENLQRMKDAGVPAIPVFHQGEDFKWLIRYIEEGEPYIGISPSGDVIKFDTNWFDECFKLCTNSDGEPIVKTHGFGVSSPNILVRYPWYSADSATWALKSGYGSLLVPQYPKYKNKHNVGEPDYALSPISVWVTGQTRETDRFDFQTFGEVKRNSVLHFLEKEVETSITVMMYHPHERMRAMLVYYKKLGEHLRYSKFPYDGGLTGYSKPKPDGKAVRWDHKKVITAVGSMMSLARSHMMCEAGVLHRLASYWEIQDLPVDKLELYVNEGTLAPYKEGKPPSSWGSVAYKNYRALRLYDRLKHYEVNLDETD